MFGILMTNSRPLETFTHWRNTTILLFSMAKSVCDDLPEKNEAFRVKNKAICYGKSSMKLLAVNRIFHPFYLTLLGAHTAVHTSLYLDELHSSLTELKTSNSSSGNSGTSIALEMFQSSVVFFHSMNDLNMTCANMT